MTDSINAERNAQCSCFPCYHVSFQRLVVRCVRDRSSESALWKMHTAHGTPLLPGAVGLSLHLGFCGDLMILKLSFST